MELSLGQVVSVDGSNVSLKVIGGRLNGRQLTETARPLFPPGCDLPPVVGDHVFWLYLDSGGGRAPRAPHYLALSGVGVDIVVDPETRVMTLKEGTKGAARLDDTTRAGTTMAAWVTAVTAAITALDAGAPVTIPTPPSDFGVIDSASTKVILG